MIELYLHFLTWFHVKNTRKWKSNLQKDANMALLMFTVLF